MTRLETWLLCLVVLAPVARADDAAERGRTAAAKAVAYLKTQQRENGSFQRGGREPPAVTALVLRALVQDDRSGVQSPEVRKAVAYLLSVQQEDGGIASGTLANYNTAICVSGLTAVKDPALKGPIDKAVAYLKANQFTDAVAGPDGAKITPAHPFYGGWGYGGTKGRPDVSNAAIVVEALKDAGVPKDDPAYKAALEFVTRMQNHSETNPAKWATDDGGFIYSPGRSGDGESSAGEYATAEGRRALRSYGSMTYAGLKSMLYAGLTKDDARVKAAWRWIGKNWTLEENPGMRNAGPENAKSGIFYYYHTLARSLNAYGEPKIAGADGAEHDWRVELIDAMSGVQKRDGSFAGDRRWMEDNPVIATTLATLAIQDALKDMEHRASKRGS